MGSVNFTASRLCSSSYFLTVFASPICANEFRAAFRSTEKLFVPYSMSHIAPTGTVIVAIEL